MLPVRARTNDVRFGEGRRRPPIRNHTWAPAGSSSAPSAAFRDAVRSVVLTTLELYVGIVEALADEADREDGDDGETMH